MKTNRLLAVLSVMILAACTKSIKQPLKADSVIQSSVTTSETVVFRHSEIANDPTWAVHNGYSTSFVDVFHVPHDTGYYFKKAICVLTKSPGAKLTKLKMFVDDSRKIFDISNAKNGDTLTFSFITAVRLKPNPVNNDPTEHSIRFYIGGDGINPNYFRIELVDVIIFKKYPQPQVQIPTSGLPEIGRKMVYP